MPSSQEIAAAMAAADKRNRLTKVEQVAEENVKAFPAFGENLGLRIAMAGSMPGGWSSDHRSETDKFSGWHYIAIHAIYKQVIQATVEVYEQRLVVPDFKKPAPPQPGVEGQPQDPSQPQIPGMAPAPGGGFTKSINEHADGKVAMPQYDPFLRKLKRPNPNQTLNSFNGERAMQLCLTGRVLVWNVRSILTGAIIERYVIPTCLAQPRPPSKELPRGGWYVLPEGARYAEEAGYYMVGTLEAAFGKTIPAEDIQIIKFPHPKYKDDGQSPVSAGALWTDTSEMVDKSRHNHLKQGPDPSVIVGLDADVDEMSMRRAEALFNDRYSGVDKHGRAMFVTPTKTIQPLTTAPKDMSYESGFEQLRDAQLALHGVPLAAVGLSSPSGREGLYAPLLQFIELSVQPILTLLGEEDSALFNTDREREVQIVYTAKKFNDEDLQEKQIQTDIQAGILTKGELRKLRGREPFGDERDDEMCGASAAPPPGMMPPGMPPVPPGSVPGAPEQPPEGQPTVSNPEQQAPNQKMPMGRAMQSSKPRLANQIAKALAKQLEAYGIFKGGPGSGNFGHEGRPGQVGGSAPDDGGGGGSAGTSPSSSGPSSRVLTRDRRSPERLSQSRFESIPDSVRSQLSSAAFRFIRSGDSAGQHSVLGGTFTQTEAFAIEDAATAYRRITGNEATRETIEGYYREQREQAGKLVYRGASVAELLRLGTDRARETRNFEGISSAEAKHHVDIIARENWRIASAIAGTKNPQNLARNMTLMGYNQDDVAQITNLGRAIHGDVDATEGKTGNEIAEASKRWVETLSDDARVTSRNHAEQMIDETIAGDNPLARIVSDVGPWRPDASAAPPETRENATARRAREAETSVSEAGIERTIKPRQAPEPVDGLTAKPGRVLKDITERASKFNVVDEPPPSDSVDLTAKMKEAAVAAWNGNETGRFTENSKEHESLIENANLVMVNIDRRTVQSTVHEIPSSVRDAVSEYVTGTLADRAAGRSPASELYIEEFFKDSKEEFEAELVKFAGGDEEKLQAAKDSLAGFKDDVVSAVAEADQNIADLQATSKKHYIQDFISTADPAEFEVEVDTPKDDTWYQYRGDSYQHTVRAGGENYDVKMRPADPTQSLSQAVRDMIGLPDEMVSYDLSFTDPGGNYSVTGEQREKRKETGRSAELEVFRGVSSAVLGFVQKKEPDIVTFTAIEEKRQKLYDKLTQTIAQIGGKYVAVVHGGGDESAHYFVVKREYKDHVERLVRSEMGEGKIDWLVKRFAFGVVKSSSRGWVTVYDYFKGGPGSGNFGHEGRPGQVGGSAPDDGGGGGMAGTSPSEKKEKKPAAARGGKVAKPKKEKAPAAKKDKKPSAADLAGEVENPKVLSVHPAARGASSKNIDIDVSRADKKEWNHAPSADITKFNRDNGFVRGKTEMSVVDYSKKLEEQAVKVPIIEKTGKNTYKINTENIERVAVKLADMTEEADSIDPTWSKWYSEIEGVSKDLSKEEGEFNFSKESQKLLKTQTGQKLFVGMLAVSSQEAAPDENLRTTKNLYDFYTANGRMPTYEEARPLVESKARDIIAQNVVKYAKVMAHFNGDVDKTFDFMNGAVRAGKLKEVFAEIGIETSKGVGYTDQYVPRSYLFGPKIGAFHANLGGVEDLLTQDRWLTRTIGRLTGTIGFTEEQLQKGFNNVLQYEPTDEHLKYMGLTAKQTRDALNKLSLGEEVSDDVMAKLNRLAQAHVSSGPESKEKIIERNDFTTKLNTAMKKTKDVINSPGSATARHANQLAAETAVKILKQRGKNYTVREIQAAVWMLEKKRWYEAGVGSKKGDANSYKVALEKMRRGEQIESDSEDFAEEFEEDDE